LVFIPLVVIALCVNQITSFTKETFKSFVLRDKQPTDDSEDNEIEDELDEKSVKDKDEGEDDDSTKVDDNDDNIVEVTSEDSSWATYAPIFGRWKFHTRIPIVRKLWRRQVYLNTRDDDSDYLFDEGIEMDYPLNHFLSNFSLRKFISLFQRKEVDSDDDSSIPSWMLEPPRRRQVVVEEFRRRASFGSRLFRRRRSDSDEIIEVIEEDLDLPRSRVSRVFQPVERLFRKRGQDEEESSDSDGIIEVIEEDSDHPRFRANRVLGRFRRRAQDQEENPDSDEIVEVIEEGSDHPQFRASRVFRPVEQLFRKRDRGQEAAYAEETRSTDREIGAASGSDRQEAVSMGLGAALPDPLRRLFVRRRRVHDIESGFVDE
jgi:hypothetical protein